ncbi:MAG TPA: N-6 DNA methylase, partial [Syntrophales bacterium]|nr:N-6 DNA methylase [Syntrophales bacterium]
LRRYGWSAKLPLSILTDFEDFAVYDCRLKPLKTDKVSHSRILILRYTDYIDRWEEIAGIFSREAILKGSFDKYVESKKIKKGTTEVDAAFLQEIEQWRELLARNIALRNPSLTQRELNYAVQQTIDRIVFLRICEDRGIETYGGLMALRNGEHVYQRLFQLFNKADDKYNSGLFHFKKEKDRETFDNLTPNLHIDDKPLKEIFKNLYYPESPYEFSVLPADILGQVYEKFLGKVIRLTEGHQAKIEEKPEVRKAGGVYYTPAYIVDYIVKNTVGKLVEGKKPGPKGGVSHLKILDPACGSGSFLIGAYQFLLDWHRDAYINDGPENWSKGKTPRVYLSPKGEWRLTTDERKRILLNNIYGVDIDHQAVEVTKLSLLLKVLEGEDEQSIGKQMLLFHERVLPDLSKNIKCGNSLIGPDFYDRHQTNLFEEDEIFRVNAFDWHAEFAEIMKNGGFDAVIGNPPYVRIQAMNEWAPLEVDHYKRRYRAASKGNYDIYVVFVEKGLELLNGQGRLGYILPNKFLVTDYGRPIRELTAERCALSGLIDFGHEQIFLQATTYTCLLFLSGSESAVFKYAKVKPSSQALAEQLDYQVLPSSSLSGSPWFMATEELASISAKLNARSVDLLSLPSMISRGSSSGDDKVFILQSTSDADRYLAADGEVVELEAEVLRVPLFATDFSRYRFAPKADSVILFPYQHSDDGPIRLIDEYGLKSKYPKVYRYLLSRRKQLEKRKQFKAWYGFSAPRNLEVHDSAQLVVPLLADKGLYAELPPDRVRYCLMAGGGFSITVEDKIAASPRYVLGLLNSRLLFWRLRSISNVFRGGWITCTKQYVGTLPIRTINFADPSDKARHD